MFIESKYIKHLGRKVRTPFGYQTIEYVHKTKMFECLKIYFNNDFIIVAKHHTFIVNQEEIQADQLGIGDTLEHVVGDVQIRNIEDVGVRELYDISLDQDEFENQWYYTNGILSHNSGKSITVACYLVWLFNFKKTLNIGIVANRKSQAKEFLRNVKDIYTRLPMWLTKGIIEWNKESIAAELETRVLTDVPTVDAFRGFSVHCVVVDECGFIKEQNWEEFADSIFPSQSSLAWKKNIIISTANGLNHFYEIVQRAKAANIARSQGEITDTTLVDVDWREVPRYKADGSKILPEEFRRKIIEKYGRVYFEQNYGNSFVGSSDTLIDSNVLENMKTIAPIDDYSGLKVYEEPVPGNSYIMGVDASKDGEDAFAVQIVDVTKFPFRQVATAQLQINYLLMPEFLYEWGALYNSALMIIENNEGAGQSIADTLMSYLEYPNLHFDDKKLYPGFRTTPVSRNSILKMLQVLANSDKLNIVDEHTIEELLRFEKVNGKYQAAGGHDDLVMALALALSPLVKVDNFEDYGLFLKSLKSEAEIDTSTFLMDLFDTAFADDL